MALSSLLCLLPPRFLRPAFGSHPSPSLSLSESLPSASLSALVRASCFRVACTPPNLGASSLATPCTGGTHAWWFALCHLFHADPDTRSCSRSICLAAALSEGAPCRCLRFSRVFMRMTSWSSSSLRKVGDWRRWDRFAAGAARQESAVITQLQHSIGSAYLSFKTRLAVTASMLPDVTFRLSGKLLGIARRRRRVDFFGLADRTCHGRGADFAEVEAELAIVLRGLSNKLLPVSPTHWEGAPGPPKTGPAVLRVAIPRAQTKNAASASIFLLFRVLMA